MSESTDVIIFLTYESFNPTNSQLHHNMYEISLPDAEIWVMDMKGLNYQSCEQKLRVNMGLYMISLALGLTSRQQHPRGRQYSLLKQIAALCL